MGIQNGRRILRVKLCSDIPFVRGNFYNFNKSCSGVFAGAYHAFAFVFFKEFVVELVTVSVAFLDEAFFAVSLKSAAAFEEFALVCAESHFAAHAGYVFLLLHDVDYLLRC